LPRDEKVSIRAFNSFRLSLIKYKSLSPGFFHSPSVCVPTGHGQHVPYPLPCKNKSNDVLSKGILMCSVCHCIFLKKNLAAFCKPTGWVEMQINFKQKIDKTRLLKLCYIVSLLYETISGIIMIIYILPNSWDNFSNPAKVIFNLFRIFGRYSQNKDLSGAKNYAPFYKTTRDAPQGRFPPGVLQVPSTSYVKSQLIYLSDEKIFWNYFLSL